MSNIVRRQGSARYYARINVPADLVTPLNGKKELWKSLGTTDKELAKLFAGPILMSWREEFERLRNRRTPDDHDIQSAAFRRYDDLSKSDERFREAEPSDADLDAIWRDLEIEFGPDDMGAFNILRRIRDRLEADRQQRRARTAELRAAVARGDAAPMETAVAAAIMTDALDAPPGTPERKRLGLALARGELEALQRASERDAGDFGGTPRDPLIKPSTATPRAKKGETVMDLFGRFKREQVGAMARDTWIQNEGIVRRFSEFIGRNAHVSAITRTAVRDWKSALADWPNKADQIATFNGMTFKQVIAANAGGKRPTISDATRNKYISALGRFFAWLRSNSYLVDDVMAGQLLRLDKKKKTRMPFTADELSALFASPLFTSCAGDGKEDRPGDARIRDWRYWIPLVSLYTGARLGEIAQLHTVDVRKIKSRWCFHITEEGGDKSVKTAGSARVVPIHRQLEALGFLDYHAGLAARGERRLFPEIKPDARGFMSGAPSKWFNAYFKSVGVKTSNAVNFHSFRHGIADAFRRGGYLDEEFSILLGHGKATMTGHYGNEPEGEVIRRSAMIDAVKFPGLILTAQ